MASIRSIEQIANGINLNVEVVSNYNNFLVVFSNNRSLKGVLLPVNDVNKILLENFINDIQNIDNNNIEKKAEDESLFCIPDSTLSQTTLDSNLNNNIDDKNSFCNECKRSLKKSPNSKSRSNELKRLTSHGFNECLLKKKNDISRRPSMDKKELIYKDRVNKVAIKDDGTKIHSNKEISDHPNTSSPIISNKRKTKSDEIVSIRQTKDRVLKTMANFKIIDLYAKKTNSVIKTPKLEIKKRKKSLSTENLSINSPVKLSDTSVYDFVDEDYDSEPTKPFYKEHKKSYFVDKSNDSIKVDKRRYKKKFSSDKSNKDDEIHSNPGIVSYEYKGTRFSINNIVWAKIPGYPFWPAHIKSFDNVSASKSQGKRCRINWIGWNQKSFLPLKSLLHFREHFSVKYSAKFKSQKYKTAIELACKELGLDFHELTLDFARKSPISEPNNSSQNSVFGSSKRRSIDLDDIFPSKNSTKDIGEIDMFVAKAYSDEDTDEEEKARSALVTAESLEANKVISGMLPKQSEYDF